MENNDRLEIERFSSFMESMKEVGERDKREILRRKNNRNSTSKGRKKYERSEKGKKARKVVSLNRRKRFKMACEGISDDEKKMIKEFYLNRPIGYQVDHIIPLSKGGLHHLNNLQYLLPKVNAEKAARLDYGNPVDETKTCRMGRQIENPVENPVDEKKIRDDEDWIYLCTEYEKILGQRKNSSL